jgi:alpha-tubulin suppressor-like RCC1 family protein
MGTNGELGHAKFATVQNFAAESSYFQEEPRRILKSKAFEECAIGSVYTLALTNTGHLFGFGKEFLGKGQSNIPQIFPGDRTYTQIAAGNKHSAAIDKKGQVYTWGYGGSWMEGGGQLGHDSTDQVDQPKLVERFSELGAKAASVSVGDKHTLILTTDGEVLSCGVGEYGRVGNGANDDVLVPIALEALVDDDIIQAVAGHNHSLALSVNGGVYTWGRNDTGALGHADSFVDIYSMEEFPRLLECEAFTKSGSHVVQIAAGKGRSAAVTADGKLFVWGRAMGHVPSPVENDSLEGLKVTLTITLTPTLISTLSSTLTPTLTLTLTLTLTMGIVPSPV